MKLQHTTVLIQLLFVIVVVAVLATHFRVFHVRERFANIQGTADKATLFEGQTIGFGRGHYYGESKFPDASGNVIIQPGPVSRTDETLPEIILNGKTTIADQQVLCFKNGVNTDCYNTNRLSKVDMVPKLRSDVDNLNGNLSLLTSRVETVERNLASNTNDHTTLRGAIKAIIDTLIPTHRSEIMSSVNNLGTTLRSEMSSAVADLNSKISQIPRTSPLQAFAPPPAPTRAPAKAPAPTPAKAQTTLGMKNWNTHVSILSKPTADKADKKCFSVQGGRTDNRTPIEMNSCVKYDNNQLFHFDKNTKLVKSAVGNKCLDVIDGTFKLDKKQSVYDSKIQLWDCDQKSNNQRFDYNDKSGELKWIPQGRQLPKPMCVDLPYGNTANGTQIRLWDCNGSAAQKFVQKKL
jgi:hypothetical protein